MHIALCILSRNEKPCLEVILPRLPKPSPTNAYQSWFAIDGNSTDGSDQLFQAHGVPVIKQKGKGRGDAFLTAFKEIKADAYLFFSPDGNEDPLDFQKFSDLLKNGNELVIASRMMKGAFNEEDISWYRPRKWANNAFNLAVNLAFRKSGDFVSDSINGYRAITAEAAKKLQLNALDYTIEYQMTIRALKSGLKIAEFPTHEGQRIAGETGASSFSTGIKFIKRFLTEL